MKLVAQFFKNIENEGTEQKEKKIEMRKKNYVIGK